MFLRLLIMLLSPSFSIAYSLSPWRKWFFVKSNIRPTRSVVEIPSVRLTSLPESNSELINFNHKRLQLVSSTRQPCWKKRHFYLLFISHKNSLLSDVQCWNLKQYFIQLMRVWFVERLQYNKNNGFKIWAHSMWCIHSSSKKNIPNVIRKWALQYQIYKNWHVAKI